MSSEDKKIKSSKIIGIDPFVRLLIAHALAGNHGFIIAAKKYYVDGESPSTIAREMRLSTKQVRVWIERAREKVGTNERKAQRILKKLYRGLMKVEPIADGDFCKLCGRPYAKKLIWHIYFKHAALVLLVYRRLVEEASEEKK